MINDYNNGVPNVGEELDDAKNTAKKAAKGVKSTAKMMAKLAAQNYIGAVKEFLKNPSGILKVVLAVTLVFAIIVSAIFSTLTNFFMSFFKEDSYSAVSEFTNMQSKFQNYCLAPSYNDLTEKIYIDISKKIQEKSFKGIKSDGNDISDQFNENKNEIFKNAATLEQVIFKGYLNSSNPNDVKKPGTYTDLDKCRKFEKTVGNNCVFALLEDEKNGYEVSYDKTSEEYQTNWDRHFFVIDYNKQNPKNDSPKVIYSFNYKNSKFYGNSESVSMYKALFDNLFDCAMFSANLYRLENVKVDGKLLLDTKGADGEIIPGALSVLSEKINKASKNVESVSKKIGDKTPNAIEEQAVIVSYAGIDDAVALAKKIQKAYLGEKTNEYFKYYQNSKYYEKVLIAFKDLDRKLKNVGRKGEATFAKSISSANIGGSFFNSSGDTKLSTGSTQDDEKAETNNDSDSGLEVKIKDPTIDDNDPALEMDKVKEELFEKFYSDPQFYKNLFTYTVNVDDPIDYKGGNKEIKSLIEKDKNGEEFGKADMVSNIAAQMDIDISVEPASPASLYHTYIQFFENTLLEKLNDYNNSYHTVSSLNWAVNLLSKNNEKDENKWSNFRKLALLYFTGEDLDSVGTNEFKDFTFINSDDVGNETLSKDEKELNTYAYRVFDKEGEENKKESEKDKYLWDISDYCKYQSPEETKENSDNNVYTNAKPLEKTLNFSNSFTTSFKTYNSKTLYATVYIGDYEYSKNKEEEWLATSGMQRNSLIGCSATLTTADGSTYECKVRNIEKSTGNLVLCFVSKDKKISSPKSLTVKIEPRGDIKIRNIQYQIGSICSKPLQIPTIDKLYAQYIDAGIVNSHMLSEAGYVTANIYIQYRVSMFQKLFKSGKIEDTKRDFITDVSNIATDDNGKLLIRGQDKSRYDGELFYEEAALSKEDKVKTAQNTFYISCKPDSLIYMPKGMELCEPTGKRIGSDRFAELMTRFGDEDNRSFGVKLADFFGVSTTIKPYNLRKINQNTDVGIEYADDTPFDVAIKEGYQYCSVGSTYDANTKDYAEDVKKNNEYNGTFFFKDNLIQIMVSQVQMSTTLSNGSNYSPTMKDYNNTVHGNWHTSDAFHGEANTFYDYFKEEYENNKNDDTKYVPTVAKQPLVLGFTSQSGSGFLQDYNTNGSYDESDINTYPTFMVSVSYVPLATESSDNGIDNNTISLKQKQDVNLYDVFDLNQNTNSGYTESANGYYWPLEDSYEAYSYIQANDDLQGKIVKYDSKNNKMELAITSNTANGYSLGEINKIELYGVELGEIEEGDEFGEGDFIAKNVEQYSYINAKAYNGKSSVVSLSDDQSIFNLFKLTTVVIPNANEVIEDSSDDGKTIGSVNAIAMFSGKVVDYDDANGSVTIFKEEDDLYCEYNNINNLLIGKNSWVNAGQPIGTVKYQDGYESVNKNGVSLDLQTDDEKQNDLFTVSLYSSSDCKQGLVKSKYYKDVVVNNFEPFRIVSVNEANNYVECESVASIKTTKDNDEDDSSSKLIPKTTYGFYGIELSSADKEKLKNGKTILVNNKERFATLVNGTSQYVEIEFAYEIKYYKSLMDYFPTVNDFAKKTRKLKITVSDTENENLIGSVVTNSFPIYYREVMEEDEQIKFDQVKLRVSSIPGLDKDTGKDGERYLWEIEENNYIEMSAKGEFATFKIKKGVSLSNIKDSRINITVKIVYTDKENGKTYDAPGRERKITAYLMAKPGAVSIVPDKDYFGLNEMECNAKNPGNYITSGGKTVLVVSKKQLKEMCTEETITTSGNTKKKVLVTKKESKVTIDGKSKTVKPAFKVQFSNEITGQSSVQWTLTPSGNLSKDAYSLSLFNPKNATSSMTTKWNTDGRLIFDNSKKTMKKANEYYTLKVFYTLTPTEINRLDADDKNDVKDGKMSAEIYIHVINSVKSISKNTKNKKFNGNGRDVYTVNKDDLKNKEILSATDFEKLITWNLEEKDKGNIFGPKAYANKENMINVDITAKDKNTDVSKVEYKNGAIVYKGSNIADICGQAFNITISLNENGIAYRTGTFDKTKKPAGGVFSFTLKVTYGIKSFEAENITNSKNQNQLYMSMTKVKKGNDSFEGSDEQNLYLIEGQTNTIKIAPKGSNGEILKNIPSNKISLSYLDDDNTLTSAYSQAGMYYNSKVITKGVELKNDKTNKNEPLMFELTGATTTPGSDCDYPDVWGPLKIVISYPDEEAYLTINVYLIPAPSITGIGTAWSSQTNLTKENINKAGANLDENDGIMDQYSWWTGADSLCTLSSFFDFDSKNKLFAYSRNGLRFSADVNSTQNTFNFKNKVNLSKIGNSSIKNKDNYDKDTLISQYTRFGISNGLTLGDFEDATGYSQGTLSSYKASNLSMLYKIKSLKISKITYNNIKGKKGVLIDKSGDGKSKFVDAKKKDVINIFNNSSFELCTTQEFFDGIYNNGGYATIELEMKLNLAYFKNNKVDKDKKINVNKNLPKIKIIINIKDGKSSSNWLYNAAAV